MGRRRKVRKSPAQPDRRCCEVLPLREMIRVGRALGLSPDEAMDAERLSRAARRDDPTHPGFVEEGRKLVGLGHGRTVP